MRTRRSFGATSNNTPLFFVFSPSFQLRNSSLAYGSISWPSSEATVATTSWIPDFVSRSASFCSIAVRVSVEIIFARSTTRPESAGRVRAKPVAIVHNNAVKAMARRDPLLPGAEGMRPAVISMPLCRDGASEFYLWRLVRILNRGELRHRLVGAEEGRGPQYAGECLELGVIDPYCLDVIAPRNCNAVLGSLELRLQC